MNQPCSYAFRGTKGCGKRTKLLEMLRKEAEQVGIPFELKRGTWYLNKQVNGGDPDEDDDIIGKCIPYEESAIHLGYDTATMSMSDKLFLQSILTRWTGQQDVCLISSQVKTRYLVLYHAHLLTDESVLQLQECLEQYPTFAILLTTEFPICGRLRDFCFEIPVVGDDYLLMNYTNRMKLKEKTDIWEIFFMDTLDKWSKETSDDSIESVAIIRDWVYICLQRNLRWTDVLMYWIQSIYNTEWITPTMRGKLLETIWNAESGSGWVLVTSYRIPILWEQVHLTLASQLYHLRNNINT
jgi:hypothetical protein